MASPSIDVCNELQGSVVFPGTKVCITFNKEAVKESLVRVFCHTGSSVRQQKVNNFTFNGKNDFL